MQVLTPNLLSQLWRLLLAFEAPKTRKFMGRRQCAVITNEMVARWTQWL